MDEARKLADSAVALMESYAEYYAHRENTQGPMQDDANRWLVTARNDMRKLIEEGVEDAERRALRAETEQNTFGLVRPSG